MDPITRAVRKFFDEADAFWRDNPCCVLPIIAAEGQQALVAQALVLREIAPDNQRPLIVFEDGFTATSAYFYALAEKVAGQYEAIRVGLAADGITLPLFGGGDGTLPSGAVESAMVAMERAGRLLAERCGGIVVALVPQHVADRRAWREAVHMLGGRRWSPPVRLAVVASHHDIGDKGVRLNLDHNEPLAFSIGPDDEPPSGLRFRRGLVGVLARIEEPPRAGLDTTDDLTTSVRGGAEALAAGRPDEAAGFYWEARALCHARGLFEQEAAMLIAFAGACRQAGAVQLAADSYEQAANIAERADAWPLVGQSWLGLGGTLLELNNPLQAAAAFRAAAVAAQRAEFLSVRIEALAMAGACFLRIAREDEARVAWTEAVDVGAGSQVDGGRTLEDVGRALVTLLAREGLDQQADEVRGVVDTRRRGSP